MSAEPGDMSSDVLLGSLHAQMTTMNHNLEKIQNSLDDLSRRLTILEASNLPDSFKKLDAAVSRLELDQASRTSVSSFAKSLPQYLGWFVAAVLIVVELAERT